MKPLCLIFLTLAGGALVASAQEFRRDINPALVYYRAFLLQTEPISGADWAYLESKKGKEEKLPERFGTILATSDSQLNLVRQAGQATVPCDWGIDLSPGPNIYLPHLGRAKGICQVAQVRARWALEHGKQDDARDDLLASFALGRNTAAHDFLIGILVQQSIETLNYTTIAEHFGEFTPETLKQLVDGFDAAPARRTMVNCMAGEKYAFYDWMVEKIQTLQKAHPNDDAKVMQDFRDSGIESAMNVVGYTNFWKQLVAASGGTSEGVLKLLHEEESLFPRIARIMALPQPQYETEAQQFVAEVQKSSNPFFGTLSLYFTGFRLGGGSEMRVRAREFRTEAQSAMVRAAVEYRLHGETGLKTVMDPFGNGPFSYRRFVFKGKDRGFELRSAYAGAEAPFVMIFVEKSGAAFEVAGPNAGKAIEK